MNSRVEELFHKLADLSAAARTNYFADQSVDEEMRHEVEALLAFDSSASSILLHDIGVAASRALPQLESMGWRCGPYKLTELLGRGGMGTVYLAERADGEVTQRVAVKLLTPGASDIHRGRTSRHWPAISGHGVRRGKADRCLCLAFEPVEENHPVSRGLRRRRLLAPQPDRPLRSEAKQHPGVGGQRAKTSGFRNC